MFPKVTRSIGEFWKHEGKKRKPVRDGTYGLCGNKTIWVRTLSPITLLHEFVHYPIRQLHLKAIKFKSPLIVMFLDFLTHLHDFVNGILRYKYWRDRVHECIEVLTLDVEDWLDWVLCR